MKILIIGASSGVGFATAKEALEQGHEVRGFARSIDKVGINNPAFEKFKGDALAAADVEAALNGVDAVIQTLGVPLNLKLLTGPITLFSETTRILAPLMERVGPRRLVALTGFGAGDSKSAIGMFQRLPFHLVFGQAYADKSVQEEIIKSSDLDWTIARPGVLTDGARTGNYKVLHQPDEWRNGMISRANVAEFLVRAAADDEMIGKEPVLVN